MSKNSSSPPAAPDPQQTAQAQMGANIGTARVTGRMNRTNVFNPYYTSTWTDMGDRTRNPNGSSRAGAPAPAASRAANDPGAPAPVYPDNNDTGGDHGPQTPRPAATPASTASTASSDPNDPMAGEQNYYNQDRWSNTITLNPEEQRILDQSRRLQLGTGDLAEAQLPKIKGALDQTVTYDGLPANVTGVDSSRLQSVDPNFNRGTIQKNLSGAGQNVQTGLSGVGQNIQTGVADAGPIQRSVNPQGQWDYNDVGGPRRSLGTPDYTMQQALVGKSIYDQGASRLDPAWNQRQSELTQSLADRGIAEGSDLYNRELDRFNRERTDAYDTLGRSAITGSGDELSRLAGLDLARFNAENAAQGQAFGQTALQRGDLLNQDLSTGRFANDAQGQQYDQNLKSMQAGNAAQGQLFGQDLAAGNFKNAAQSQLFGQDLARFNAENAAQNQDVAQQQAQQHLAAQLRAQGLNEQQINAALAASARNAGYQERQNVRLQPINDTQMLTG